MRFLPTCYGSTRGLCRRIAIWNFERLYAEDDVRNFELAHSRMGLALFGTLKAARIWAFFFGPTLSLPFLMMAFVLPFGFSWKEVHPDTRFLIILVGVFFVGLL